MLEKKNKRLKRHKRVRAKIKGAENSPRLCVFRSISHIYAQLINDETGKTLISIQDSGLKGNKTEIAKKVGNLLAEKAKEKKIEKVIFDRGGYKYHGRVKALAEGAREGGLKF
ncbi:MAG TPA: 50S ribosomal protein L18 [Candidatus Pacearchaeota archaeon]|mgnify:CR=1 FL=1|nr:50S ribosomal protein L18 [Candidatus Parcubacteria bacterium]HOC53615.1 50S ribosomal protein L18 [Candidatus Pacearchaeota archaeon]HQM24675.1 50S ribosomal protein L18 [Candidatus Pacearchaeota archaeon]